MDSPTILNTQDKPLNDDIHATLAISSAEALNGTSRTLTLAGGRHVRVDVPPGIQNGQIIRVSGQDSTIGSGGATIPLLLTIAIAQGTLHYPPAFIGNDPMATSSGAVTYTGSDRTTISNNQTVLPDGTRTAISNNPTMIPGSGSPTPVLQPYYSDAAYNNGPNFPQQDDNGN